MAPRRDPAVAARRDKVCELRREGMSAPLIARTLGVSLPAVNADISNLFAEGRIDRKYKQAIDWETVKKHWNHGFSGVDIARILGCSRDTIAHVMQRMRDNGIELYSERDPRRCGLESTEEHAS